MKTKARVAGSLFVISIIARIFADAMVRDRLIVSSNATATAANILANTALFRWGFVADIIAFACYAALTACLYEIFKHVSRTVSLTAVIFNIISCTAQAMSAVFHLAALSVLTGSAGASDASMTQMLSMVMVLLKVRFLAYHSVGLVFLGFYLILIGWLAFKSRMIPRVVGVLVACAGIAYIPFLSPPFATSLLPTLLIPAGVGQIALALWLLIFGVREDAHGHGQG